MMTGIFGVGRLQAGYRGRIVSFEPLNGPFRELAASAAGDDRWEVRQRALGRVTSGVRMNVAEDSRNSSIDGDRRMAYTWAFSAEDLTEFLSVEHMRPTLGSIYPKKGQALHTNRRRPILVRRICLFSDHL